MDSVVSFGVLGQIFQAYGPFGILVVVWYFDRRDFARQYKQQETYMAETRRMYENNVELVKDYSKLSTDLHDVVIMNTQAMTRLIDSIKTNQYCPAIRLEKKAGGPQI